MSNLYAKADLGTGPGQSTQTQGWSNRRGYGLMSISKFDGQKIYNDKYIQHRIQPLTQPFGNHNPPKADANTVNPQMTLAWNQ